MLKQRILTASIFATIVLLSIFYLATPILSLLLGLVALLAAWEWSKLCGIRTTLGRSVYLLVLALCGVALYLKFKITVELLLLVVAWWILSLLLLRRSTTTDSNWQTIRQLVSGAIMIVPAWYGLSQLHAMFERGALLLVTLLMTVWLADIGAYTAGKLWGKRKLAPTISPGKSIEGFFGGAVIVMIFGLVSGILIWKLKRTDLITWVLLIVVTGFFSVLGDLVESKAKRLAKVKDSSSLLPGHGGILDRTDSLLAATPVFLLGCLLFFPDLV